MKRIVSITVLALLAAAGHAMAIDMNPGLYRITVKMEMQGMPNMMPATTMNQCITEEDPVPNASPQAQGCEVKDMNVSGNTVSYTMVCDQEGVQSEMTGKTTYSGDSFKGATTMKMNQGGTSMVMTSDIQGNRIGDCQ